MSRKEGDKDGDITLIVCGRINSRSLDNIGKYLDCKDIKEIIIGGWENDPNLNMLKPFTNKERIRIVLKPLPTYVHVHSHLPPTLLYQIKCILNTVCEVKTKYVLRTRSEEFYNDIQIFVDKFKENPTGILCGNVLFKPIYGHMGDHLYMLSTKECVNMMTTCDNWLQKGLLLDVEVAITVLIFQFHVLKWQYSS